MTKIVLFLFMVLLIQNAYAFDFHGIKSGMFENDVMISFKNAGGYKFPSTSGNKEVMRFNDKYIKKAPNNVEFSYTHDSILYEMVLTYDDIKNKIEKDAFISAMKRKYNSNFEEIHVYGDLYILKFVLRDESIVQQELNYYINSFVDKI